MEGFSPNVVRHIEIHARDRHRRDIEAAEWHPYGPDYSSPTVRARLGLPSSSDIRLGSNAGRGQSSTVNRTQLNEAARSNITEQPQTNTIDRAQMDERSISNTNETQSDEVNRESRDTHQQEIETAETGSSPTVTARLGLPPSSDTRLASNAGRGRPLTHFDIWRLDPGINGSHSSRSRAGPVHSSDNASDEITLAISQLTSHVRGETVDETT